MSVSSAELFQNGQTTVLCNVLKMTSEGEEKTTPVCIIFILKMLLLITANHQHVTTVTVNMLA